MVELEIELTDLVAGMIEECEEPTRIVPRREMKKILAWERAIADVEAEGAE